MITGFTDTAGFVEYIHSQQTGSIVITHQNMPGYPGMVLYIGFAFDVPASNYTLNLEYMSLGLDLYGDTLQENHIYKFPDVAAVAVFLDQAHHISVADICVPYSFDPEQFPNPLTNEKEKPAFEAGWKKFREDYRKGIFAGKSQELIYQSHHF